MTAKTARTIARRINGQEVAISGVQSALVVRHTADGRPDYTVALIARDGACIEQCWTADDYTAYANR